MQYMTDKFRAAIVTSHTVFSYVEVKGPNQDKIVLQATGGSVSVDRTATVRRRCTIDCIDPLGTLTPDPEGTSSPLTPYGTEIRPYRGVMYPDGTTEVMALGVFRLSQVSIEDTNDGLTIALEAYDLSRTVARDKFTTTYTVAAGTNIITAIRDILARTFDDLEYDTISTPRTTSLVQVFDVGDDPWEAVTTLATSLGCDIYFDVLGKVVIAPPVDIGALPAADFKYIEGESCTLMGISRVFTDDPGYNGVVVTGESPSDDAPPVRAIAWDSEPTSLTYHNGPYGEVPMFVTDQHIKTTQDAQDAADALLRNQLGFASQLSVTVMVNPGYEAGDVVEVVRAKSHVDDLFTLDAFNVPLEASGTQGLILRQKRRVST